MQGWQNLLQFGEMLQRIETGVKLSVFSAPFCLGLQKYETSFVNFYSFVFEIGIITANVS